MQHWNRELGARRAQGKAAPEQEDPGGCTLCSCGCSAGKPMGMSWELPLELVSCGVFWSITGGSLGAPRASPAWCLSTFPEPTASPAEHPRPSELQTPGNTTCTAQKGVTLLCSTSRMRYPRWPSSCIQHRSHARNSESSYMPTPPGTPASTHKPHQAQSYAPVPEGMRKASVFDFDFIF